MNSKVKVGELASEIMKEMEALEAELNKPVNTPLTAKPMNGGKAQEKKTGRASDEYKEAMLQQAETILEMSEMFFLKELIRTVVISCRKNTIPD